MKETHGPNLKQENRGNMLAKQCIDCLQFFSSRFTLYQHKLKDHPDLVRPRGKPKPTFYVCHEHDKRYTSVHSWIYHKNACHAGEDPNAANAKESSESREQFNELPAGSGGEN